MATDTVLFNGIKFRRYPDAKRRSDRMYYTPDGTCRQNGVGRLHEEIWKSAHGRIPKGSHIHHRDGNSLNNALENLECLDAGMHLSLHHRGRCSRAKRAHLERIRPLASAWHRSTAGHVWHKRHGREASRQRTRLHLKCEICGKSCTAINNGRNRFCGPNCRQADIRRRRKAGL